MSFAAVAGDILVPATFLQIAGNLVPVTLGNIIGGSMFVALSYYVIYLRGR